MSWEAIGAIGEVVGAAAVVVTLIFLLAQLRQNTRALDENSRTARRAVADRNFKDLSRWRTLLVEQPDLTAIWHRGCAGEPLDDTDAERFVQLMNELLFGLWRGFQGAKSVNDEVYREEIVQISASFGTFPTIGRRLEQLADDEAFREYATAVLPRIQGASTDPASGVLTYRGIRPGQPPEPQREA